MAAIMHEYTTLFDTSFTERSDRPLADILRPQALEEVVGQEHLLGASGALQAMLAKEYVPSMILWGPPGCGKTTLARLIARKGELQFHAFSAVSHSSSDIKRLLQKLSHTQHKSLLLVDEIHRFNRAQQDVFLPYIEDGTVILVGATTENPSFELNPALLSRCQVFELQALAEHHLASLLVRAEEYMDNPLPLDEAARSMLLQLAQGDGRYLLGLCEQLMHYSEDAPITAERLSTLLLKRSALYDKNRDYHYHFISALHKSLRGSDVDAALYWFTRMLDGGEDPLYIARRLVRFASEDIGLADPDALSQALLAKQAYEQLGAPEGELSLAQAVVYLAMAPKSNAVYTAFKRARIDAQETSSLLPPKHILNAPTSMMKQLGYNEGYRYDHDEEAGFSGQNYFPEAMERQSYYQPVERGFERQMCKRLAYWNKLREQKQ